MRTFQVFVLVVVVSLLAGCTANLRGGLTGSRSDNIAQPSGNIQFIYDGERGTVTGVEWPAYSITPVAFGDTIVSVITPPGWSVNRLDNLVHMQNRRLEALIIIAAARYPDLELLREMRNIREQGFEISDLVISNDARLTSWFSYVRPDGEAGAMIGLYSDYRDSSSGIVVFGRWSVDRTEEVRPQMERIAKNVVIRVISQADRS
ncbi:hypothetical protein KKF05_01395 [Patescibacteria group bacterium]|nr:hypothetical protein [Patescibacteria group bacterium]MBU1028965.1 hypothetical protein [Patescibacteria group bacterium]MBU1916395.1 hypothetical protein [Patescibacteria group bacterium]